MKSQYFIKNGLWKEKGSVLEGWWVNEKPSGHIRFVY
jgi:hypothetical protein